MPNNEDVPPRTPRGPAAARMGPVWVAFLVAAAAPQWACAAPSTADWKTGPELELELRTVVGVRWSSNPLRDALGRLSRHQRVAIFLDRRIDPDQLLEFSSTGRDLLGLLREVAGSVGQGACRLGPVVYIGPQKTTSLLATLAALREDQRKDLPLRVQEQLRRAESVAWPELTEPRRLIQRLAADAGLTVEGIERIPHDLWPDADLPPMNFSQRMTLVLAGFGMTFQYLPDGSAIRLVPMPAAAALERSYRLGDGQQNVQAVLKSRFPGVEISVASGQLTVVGTVEQHEQIKRLLHGTPTRKTPVRPPAGARTVYTLTIKSPVGQIAKGLASQLGLQVQFAPGTDDRLGQPVTVDVKEATLEELLDAVFGPAGLSYELTGQSLRVLPGQRP